MKKIGIFGGTFNPIHKGHELIALQFYDIFKLDELLIIPSNISPHKLNESLVTPQERFAMCEIAFSNFKCKKNIIVSDIETKNSNISYTFNTLTALHSQYKNKNCKQSLDFQFYFLIGSDMLFYLDKWYRYKDLFDLCTFVVTRRFKDDLDSIKIESMIKLYKDTQNKQIEFLKIDFLEISSTQIRNKIKNKEDVSEYLSSKVMSYIQLKNMYR